MFSQHILTSPEVQEEEQSILHHILEMPIETNKEQFECLGLIGNYHLTPYPDSNSNVPKLIDVILLKVRTSLAPISLVRSIQKIELRKTLNTVDAFT